MVQGSAKAHSGNGLLQWRKERKMAGVHLGCLFVVIFFIVRDYSLLKVEAGRACLSSDYGSLLLPCNENRTRSIIPFIKNRW